MTTHRQTFAFLAWVFLTVATVVAPCAAALDSTVRWIWYPERAGSDCVGESRFFRKVFTLLEAPAAATLTLVVDDRFEAFVNGEAVKKTAGKRNAWDVSTLLRPGENLIAIKGYNATGAAGAIATLEVRLASGKEMRVVTDASWRTAREDLQGWDRLGFDDRAWKPAQEIGDAFAPPWHNLHYDAEDCATTAERQARDERLQRERREVEAAIAFLAKQTPSRAKVIFRRGWPLLEVDGQVVPSLLYSPRDIDPDTPEGAALIRQFREAGFHLYHLDARLASAWQAAGRFDFSAWDRLLNKILALDPEARIILGIRLDAPKWWMESHKEEWVGYATGPAQSGADQIARYRAASMASEVWMRETGEALRAGLRHLESLPCGKRVVGYQPNYGVYCEWHYYGMANDMPDTGPAMTRRFRAWLRATYKDAAALRDVWKDPAVTFENATVPGREARLRMAQFIFRDPATADRQTIDYYQCHQRAVADCLLHYCRIVKKETKERALTGAWYGYHFGMRFPPEGWHLLLGEILKSPLVDFLSSPYCYDGDARGIGGDGRIRTAGESLRLHGKLHLYEADTRTHLAEDEIVQARTRDETIACVRREAGHALIRGSGLWWVDFGAAHGKGWFNDPEVMAELARLRNIAAAAQAWDGSSASEVALVCDPKSMSYLGYPPTLGYKLITGVYTELCRTGAPFDTILLDDIGNASLPDYRVYIFLNCFCLDAAERARIAQVVRQKGKTAVWFYGAGFLRPEGASAKNLSDLTGMQMEVMPVRAAQVAEMQDTHNALAASLPKITRTKVEVQSSEVLGAASDPALWRNLRPAAVMKKEFEHHSLDREKNVTVWRFRLREKHWTDIHCLAPLPQCDALGLSVRAPEKPFTFQVDLVDAKGIPWSAPFVGVESREWRTLSFPIADFRLAAYARERADAPQFPIKAIKLVAEMMQPGTDYTLDIGDVTAQKGPSRSLHVAVMGDAGLNEGPVFAVTDPDATVLGSLVHRDRRYGVLAERRFADWTSLVVSLPFASREFLAALLNRTGVHRYLDGTKDVLLANRSLLLIHTREGGTKTVRLHGSETLTDLTTGETLRPRNGSVAVEMAPASTRLFHRIGN
ncbi:MAG: beta-galactosidase [Verrucomicrobiia bacterium]